MFARLERIICGEARNLRARPSAARRTVVHATRTEHEVPPRTITSARWGGEFDMIDLRSIVANNPSLRERAADGTCVVDEFGRTTSIEWHSRGRGRQEEPVATPSDIAYDFAEPLDIDCDSLARSPRGNTCDFNDLIGSNRKLDHPNRCIESMRPILNSAEMSKRLCDADRSMPTHSEKACIVEEDHSSDAVGLVRFDNQCADEYIRSSGLLDGHSPKAVVPARESFAPLTKRSDSQVWSARDDHARRFAFGMTVDRMDSQHRRSLGGSVLLLATNRTTLRRSTSQGSTIDAMSSSRNDSPSATQILLDTRLNKGGAFTELEREELGLVGLMPDGVEPMGVQLDRARLQFEQQSSDIGKYQFLSALQDRQERLFYALLRSDFQRYMPIVYTPTVGEACQKFGHIMRRPKGMYLSIRRKGRLAETLRNWPEKDVRFIVVTDGERILGLGDQGVCGIGIPIGKLALYTACAGVPPQVALPVVLDLGTNNEAFLRDPLYPGLRIPRIVGDECYAFIDEFVAAVQEVFPRCCIQFEDFTNKNAIPLLERYRNKVCCFNDDIQGTASVAVAGLFGACRLSCTKMSDQRLLFMGAGSAAVGIADLFVKQLCGDGVPESAAVDRCWFVNSRGLVHAGMPKLPDYLTRFAHDVSGIKFPAGAHSGPDSPLTRLSDVVEAIRPTAIIGVSTVAHAFNESVIRSMARLNARPIIFPLSNPTSKSECTAEEAIRWSEGRAIVATGSPFPPLHFGGKLFVPGQGNNVYIYPAVGLAVYATEANRVTDEMFLRAAESLASQTTDQDLSVGLIYPPISSIYETSIEVAIAVTRLIFDRGLARVPRPDDIAEFVRGHVYDPSF